MAASHINVECKRYGCIKNLLACYANCRYNARCGDLKKEIEDKTEEAASDINAYLYQKGKPPITVQIQKRGVKFAGLSKAPAKPRRRKSLAALGKARIRRSISKDSAIKKREDSESSASKDPVEVKSKNIKKSRARKTTRNAKPGEKKTRARPAKMKTAKKPSSSTVSKKSRGKKVKANKEQKPLGRVRQPSRGAKSVSRKSKAMRKKSTLSVGKSANVINNDSVVSPDQAITAPKRKRASKTTSAKKKSPARVASSRTRKSKTFIILEGDTATLVDEQGLMSHLISGGSSKARYFEASEVEARVQIVQKR